MRASRTVDTSRDTDMASAIAWWTDLTESGGEGMVVKPLEFIQFGKRGLLQPAVKCRGREYLRIVYGPEYTAPANLERFVKKEPLRKVHECVFGVLALESEPVDPRL
ncbi:MAG: hypothetical protein ACKVQA_21180 [Burkholderiales bacterium]